MTKTMLVLDKIPTDLNAYINAERSNRFMGAKIKKENTEYVYWRCKEEGLKPIAGKVRIDFFWYCKSKRKNPDNICAFA